MAIAARNGHLAVCRLLLAEGKADPDMAGTLGGTAVYAAACNGHTDVLQLLLSVSTATADATMSNGLTPLVVASTCGHAEACRLLLTEGGSDVNKARYLCPPCLIAPALPRNKLQQQASVLLLLNRV